MLRILGTTLKRAVPTRERAIQVLKAVMKRTNLRDDADASLPGSQVVLEEPVASALLSQPPAAKKYKLNIFKATDLLEESPGRDEEIDAYMQTRTEEGMSCPLSFWKNRHMTFPSLAQLAKTYLAIPATSGAVERLFSVAGAICRARRAKIKTETVENYCAIGRC